jgi:hypothetical protein
MRDWGIARRRRKRYTESSFANRISAMTRDEIIAMIRKNAKAITAEGVAKLGIAVTALNSIWPFHDVARVTVLNEDPSSS